MLQLPIMQSKPAQKMALQRAFPALISLAVAGGIWTQWPETEQQPTLPPPTAAATPVSERTWFETDNRSAGSAEIPVVPLSQQVDNLLASGKPADAYKAFALVQACVDFAKEGDLYTQGNILPGSVMPEMIGMSEEQKARQVKLCKDVTQRMRDSRLDHLAIAARAGVRGASIDFYDAGPFGDPSALVSRPNDPLVIQWKQQAIAQLHASADKGDLSSLGIMVMYRLGGNDLIQDPIRYRTYMTAWRTIIGSKGFSESHFPYEAGLSNEQIAQANEAADRIVRAFRRSLGG